MAEVAAMGSACHVQLFVQLEANEMLVFTAACSLLIALASKKARTRYREDSPNGGKFRALRRMLTLVPILAGALHASQIREARSSLCELLPVQAPGSPGLGLAHLALERLSGLTT